jgi:hypothetical protein
VKCRIKNQANQPDDLASVMTIPRLARIDPYFIVALGG